MSCARRLGVAYCFKKGRQIYLYLRSFSWTLEWFKSSQALTHQSVERHVRQHHHQPERRSWKGSKLKAGNASQFNDIHSFFCQGYFEAGAPSWLWKWIFDDWSSCSAASSARPRSGAQQGLLCVPPGAVRLWDAGEAGHPKLSSRRGDEWTWWDDDERINFVASLVTLKCSWWLLMWS